MKIVSIALLILVALGAAACVGSWLRNPAVIRELQEEPDGERARKVMLLTLPSGKAIPVNYIQDPGVVYAAADFPWWRELREPAPVTVLVQGQTLRGQGRAVLDEPELRTPVFERLRPTAPSWTGTLIEVRLDPWE